jgi:hypothetical protein
VIEIRGSKKMMIDDSGLTDKLGGMIASFTESPEEKSIPGEIYIFVGVEQQDGKQGIKCFPGTNTNTDFKGRVCEAAMEIFINDSEIRQVWEETEKAS